MSFLQQLKPTPVPGQPDTSPEMWALPPRMPGEVSGSNPILATLRLRQLIDLARAYGVEINRDGTKRSVLRQMEAADENGVFRGPPKNPYYFERAKFNSDEVQEAKLNGGYTKKGRAVSWLFGWRGPDPEADAKPPKPVFTEPGTSGRKTIPNVKKGEAHWLRQECKRLGLNSFGKGVLAMKEMIQHHTGKKPIAPGTEVQDAPEITELAG